MYRCMYMNPWSSLEHWRASHCSIFRFKTHSTLIKIAYYDVVVVDDDDINNYDIKKKISYLIH